MANNIIDFDQPSDFRREDWIGKGKWFPARNISVIALLKTSLPPQSQTCRCV